MTHSFPPRRSSDLACATDIEEEVAMLFRNLRRAFREATAACFIDQAPGLVPIRVLEGGTASAGPQGLRCFALGCDAVHFRADEGGIAGRALAKRPDHASAFWKIGRAAGRERVGKCG